jgi:DNA polymerase elongation subunit (family B)
MMEVENMWYEVKDNILYLCTPYEKFKSDIRPYFFVTASVLGNVIWKLRNEKVEASIERCSDLRPIDSDERVHKISVDIPAQVPILRGDKSYEADIPYVRRYMIDKGIKCLSNYNKFYVDIEVDDSEGFPDIKKAEKKILCIGIVSKNEEKWFGGYDEIDIINDFVKYIKGKSALLVSWGEFDKEYLYRRVKTLKLLIPKFEFLNLYDVYRSSYQRALPTYRLEYVAKHEGMTNAKKEKKKVHKLSIEELEKYNLNDCRMLFFIDDKLNLADVRNKIAYLSYVFPSETVAISRVIDAKILRIARDLGYVLPTSGGKKGEEETFKGAMVLQPERGIVNDVVVLDVVSMYPSIILEKKISPDKEKKIYPMIVEEWLNERLKAKAKGDIVLSNALKTLLNAMYGFFGFKSSRIYKRELAEEITKTGREIVTKVIDSLRGMGYKVCYADTDSVFVMANGTLSEKLGEIVNKIINSERIRVEVKGHYKKAFFLGVKKKYVLWKDKDNVELVGVEAVRSDWFKLAQKVQVKVLDMLYEGRSDREIYNYLKEVRKLLFKGYLDDMLVMSIGINKRSYEGNVRQVKLMKEYRKLSGRDIAIGEKVEFVVVYPNNVVIVDGEVGNVKNIDYDYYYGRLVNMVERTIGKRLVGKGKYKDMEVLDLLLEEVR